MMRPEPAMRRSPVLRGLLAASAFAMVAACSAQSDKAEVASASGDAVEDVLNDGDMTTLATALKDTGLVGAFEGAGSYTLLAPGDAVFANLGEEGQGLMTEEGRPALAELLRDHIIPGYVTPADIEKAIKTAPGGKVEMETMGDTTVTFTSRDGALMVSSQGANAKVIGTEAKKAGSSSVIPVDGLLKAV